MALCRYFSSGSCKFGDNCRNKHEVRKIKPLQINSNYQHSLKTIPNKLENLKFPSVLNDNLSRNIKWDVPSPTVQSEKNFFSSDSDYEDQIDQEDISNDLAIIACMKCGFKELKQLSTNDKLCLKCKEMSIETIKSNHQIGAIINDKENVDHEGCELRKRRKRKKKKLPIKQTNNLDELFEGTPEGVKVYRVKEEHVVSNDGPVESINLRGIVKSKKKKPPLLNLQSSKGILEPTKIETIDASCDEEEDVLDTPGEDVLDSQNEKCAFKLDSIFSAIFLLMSLSDILPPLLTKCKINIVELFEIIKFWCLSALRAVSGSKSTKYSRRRRIFK